MTAQIIAVVGKSNSGKTTLLVKILACLTERGYRIGTAKHTHCGFDFDRKGTDSWHHRQAGASATLLISDDQSILIKDDTASPEQRMTDNLKGVDLVLAEGFKSQDLPKIEVFRKDSNHTAPLFSDPAQNVSKTIIAFVTDSDYDAPVPVFKLDNVSGVADFIESRYLKK